MPPNTTASTGDKPAKSGRKKGRKARLFVLVLVLAIIGGIAYGGYWSISTVRASFPQTKGSITLDGLSGPVDVKRDGYGIPQIYASTDEDLFMAQGFVQAQDRFYEMDVRRHMTSGRLSEMFGKSQVDNDEFLRTLGWDRIAKQEYEEKLSGPPRVSTPICRARTARRSRWSTRRSGSPTTTSPPSGRPSTRSPG
jgi:penicillin amidase